MSATLSGLRNHYADLSALPRRPNRARYYLIPDRIPGTRDPEWYAILTDNNRNEAFELQNYIISRDSNKGSKNIGSSGDLLRGDIAVISHQLDSAERGLLIFNGSSFDAFEEDTYGNPFLPPDYQVITEFPIQYWSDMFSTLVPFNFVDSLGAVKYANLIQTITGYLYPFKSNEVIYYIFADNYQDIASYAWYHRVKDISALPSISELADRNLPPLTMDNLLVA